MEHSSFSQMPPATHNATTQVRFQPLNSTGGHQSHFRGSGDGHGLPPLHTSGIDNVGISPLFHTPEFNGFPSSYTGLPSGSVVSAPIPSRAIGTALPPLNQFGTPSQSPAADPAVTGVPRDGSTDLAKADPANGSGSLGLARGGQLPANIVENPPDLHLWRQKLFDLQSPVILTNEE